MCKNGESGCWNGFRERLGVCVRERGREYANMLYVVERERERERWCNNMVNRPHT